MQTLTLEGHFALNYCLFDNYFTFVVSVIQKSVCSSKGDGQDLNTRVILGFLGPNWARKLRFSPEICFLERLTKKIKKKKIF